MINWVARLVIIYWFLIRHAHGFGSGAPPSQCGTMQPVHSNIPSQNVAIPYTLSSSSRTYSVRETIEVTLSSIQNTAHRGFLIKAEDSNGNLAGTMIPGDTSNQKTITCGTNFGDSITHKTKLDKLSSTFSWKAPNSLVGDVFFRVTVVQNYSTFWVDHELLALFAAKEIPETTTVLAPTTTSASSDTETPSTAPSASETKPTTPGVTDTPQAQTTFVSTTDSTKLTTTPFPVEDGKIAYDPECGSSKGCFVKCKGENCEFMVTWRDVGNAVRFEIYGKPDGAAPEAWVAVGFSTDTRMGEDSVTECVYTNGMVQAFNSYNRGYSNTRLMNPQRGLSQIQGNYVNGILMCSFIRDKQVPGAPQMFNLEQDWHIMYANGRALSVPAWSISMHSLMPNNYPQTSAVMVDYQSYVVVGSGAKYPLVKAHGCLMIFAWVLFTGVGIVAARYYKNVWVDKTFMKLKIWFQVHRFSMVAAVLCNAIAFIIIFVEVGGYSNIPDIPGKSYLRSHPVIGIIITILSVINPLMALFRPDPEHSKRPIFNWAHWGVGMAAYILSTICICFGFQLGKSHTPDYAIYIMIVYVTYIIIFDITLEMMEVLAKREKQAFPSLKFLRKGKVEQVEMSNVASNGTESSIPNGNTGSKGKVKKTDKTKTLLLAVHMAFTGAFALVLVLVVALN